MCKFMTFTVIYGCDVFQAPTTSHHLVTIMNQNRSKSTKLDRATDRHVTAETS